MHFRVRVRSQGCGRQEHKVFEFKKTYAVKTCAISPNGASIGLRRCEMVEMLMNPIMRLAGDYSTAECGLRRYKVLAINRNFSLNQLRLLDSLPVQQHWLLHYAPE